MKNMRQVIKTNHNFVTGEHYEQRVLKPVQASHNRVTIQLCDASSGKVIEEAVTENAITPFLESSAYGSIANALNYSNSSNTLNGACSYPAFSSIVLSDSDIGELEDLYFIHGNVVGMCNRYDTAGAGASKYRGTYNSAESYQKFEDNGYKHIHLVYDWPTSSGNGKIQNIYWMPVPVYYFDTNGSSGYPRFVGTLQSFYGNRDKYSDLTFDKRGNAYQVKDSKYYKVLNLLKAINGIETLKTETDESFHNDYEVNGCYYTFSSSYTNSGKSNFSMTLTINKHDTTGAILDTWNEDLITNVPQLVELRNNSNLGVSGSSNKPSANALYYCDDDGWVGIQVDYWAYDYAYVLPTRNSQGELEPNKAYHTTVYSMYNVLTKQWLRVPNPWDVWCAYGHWTNYNVLKKIDNKHLCREGYLITIDVNEADVYGKAYSSSWCSSIGKDKEDSNYGYPIKFHASLPIARGYYNDYNILAVRPISAQTRLAAPITKTTLNTMKIQYDFFFKIPLPYMPPERVWDLYK